MRNSTFSIVLSIVTIIVSASLAYFLKPSIGFINVDSVYNEFNLKKELEKQYKSEIKDLEAYRDLANVEYERLNLKWQSNNSDRLTYDSLIMISKERERIIEETDIKIKEVTTMYDARIQNQLSQYLKDFAKNQNKDIVLSVMKDQEVLFHSNGIDLTVDAIEYVNNAYHGNE